MWILQSKSNKIKCTNLFLDRVREKNREPKVKEGVREKNREPKKKEVKSPSIQKP
jgi:hypothetical protein